MLGNFSCFCCHLLTFFIKSTFPKKIFHEHYWSVKWLGSRSGPATFCQDRHSVNADLDPKLLAKVIRRQKNATCKGRVKGCAIYLKEPILTLNAPNATMVVCYSHLLKCLRSPYGKQCGPSSDCSYRSSLFWVFTGCLLLCLICQ